MDKSIEALAAAVAITAHNGQTDKAGNPYWEHPKRVAEILQSQGASPDIVAAGWLHDVLEDTLVTYSDLLLIGIPEHVVDMVVLLTRAANVPDVAYYQNIRRQPRVRQVKLADIADNTNPRRLAALDDQTQLRLIKKYAKALDMLEGDHTQGEGS